MSTCAIILAADAGSGFAGPKYLTDVRGRPMLQWVLDGAVDWPVESRVVVLGSDAEKMIDSLDFRDMTVVIDPEWSEGTGSPLRASLDLVSRDRSVTRCLVTRGDQPDPGLEIVGALLERAAETSADAVVPKYRYSIGWPVVLARSLWPPFLGSEGSIDVLDMVTAHSALVEEVWFDHLPPASYESPEDLPPPRR